MTPVKYFGRPSEILDIEITADKSTQFRIPFY